LEAEIALGVNSRTRYCAERGRDQPEIAEELQAEKADLEARGLYQEDPVAPKVVTESSSTSTATSTSTTTPAGDEPPAPDKEADNADQ
jgi:capsid protein